MKKNPFNHKMVEKRLFSIYKADTAHGRRKRTFLRKMARHIEHGWEIGRRDALSGKPLVEQTEIPEFQNPDNSPMLRGILRYTYVAYKSGYKSGKEAVKSGCIRSTGGNLDRHQRV